MAFMPNNVHHRRIMKELHQNVINGPLDLKEYVIGLGGRVIAEKGVSVGMNYVNKFYNNLQSQVRNLDFGGKVQIGIVENGNYSNNSSSEIHYKHLTTSTRLGLKESDSVIWKTTVNFGKHPTKDLLSRAKQNLVTTKVLVDTERDYLGTKKRKILTSTFGFNQKRYDFLREDTYSKVEDYAFLYDEAKNKFKTKLGNINVYGDVFYENTRLKIRSETDYYSVTVKIHLVKILNKDVNVGKLFEGTFSKDKETLQEGAIPCGRQLSNRFIYEEPADYDRFKSSILTDLRCTLGKSDYFRENATIVKTFHNYLGPSDTWEFNFFMHCGPGILLNKIHEEMMDDARKHPSNYIFVIETSGDPRASITRTSDGQNFDGSSPGRIDYSFERKLRFVKREYSDYGSGNERLTTRQYAQSDDDFEDPKLQKFFQPDREEKINAVYSSVNVNRVEDSTIPYQLRYGEARLSVYLEPWVKIANEVLNNKEETAETIFEEHSDPINIRGSKKGNNTDEKSED